MADWVAVEKAKAFYLFRYRSTKVTKNVSLYYQREEMMQLFKSIPKNEILCLPKALKTSDIRLFVIKTCLKKRQ